ncbi:MAG TPA: HEAT repeat domain-containing protein, partial [Kofleriaceae bacterium]|nr:HEAT repeat domain-containing protein [Kofleriaceae bacterium]
MHRVWKLAAILFALSTVLLWIHPRWLDAPSVPRTAASRPDAGLAQQIAASRADRAETALLDALRASDDAAEIERLLTELGIVGSERVVGALASFADDARPGVAEAALGALGGIGGDTATELVFAACEHGRIRTRQAAVAALARLGSDPALARLTAIARDRSDPLWRTAVTALASAGTPAAAATLRELARARDPELRQMTLSAISDASRETIALLEGVLASGDSSTAGPAAHALARVRGTAAVPGLVRAAIEGGPVVQVACIAALGELGGSDARHALADLLERGGPSVAGAAAQALAAIGDRDAVAALVDATRGSSVARRAALAVLGQTTSPEVEALMLELVDDGTPGELRQAAGYFAQHPGPTAVAVGLRWLRDGGREQRQQGLTLLVHAASPEATAAIAELAHAPGPLRIEALTALVQIDGADPTVTRLLGDVLAQGRPNEVAGVTALLGNAGSPAAREALLQTLRGPSADAAIAAAQALARTGDRAALAAVAEAARTGDPRTRGPALQALIGTGTPEGIAAAEHALDGHDPTAAQTAVSALASVGTAEARRLLERAIAGGEPSVRLGALQALAQTPDADSEPLLAGLRNDGDVTVRQLALSGLAAVGTRAALDEV